MYVIRDKECYGHCCKSGHSLLPKIKISKDAGYNLVEIWHKDVLKFISDVGPVEKIREYIDELGMDIPSYKFMQYMDEIEVIKLASKIGAKSCVVKLLPDDATIIPTQQQIIDKYNRLLDESDKLNVTPSLEFMSLARAFNSLDDVCDILEKINNPRSSMVLDTWHLWRNDDASFTNCPFNRINPKIVSVVHFTDARKDVPQHKQRDGDRKMPEEGVLNLSLFSNRLREIGFSGVLSLNVYDKSLWDQDPLAVATSGLYAMRRTAEISKNLVESSWANSKKSRCSKLWDMSYHTHLDPRVKKSDRNQKLEEILETVLKDNLVLDYKCGFSPMAKYVDFGFDAFDGCINYLRLNYPQVKWYCQTDEEFSCSFKEKIDVLMHLGIGDSATELDGHMMIRKNCNPKIVVIECAANANGEVDESRVGNRERWEKLKSGLTGKEYFIKTDMQHRNLRLLFVGKTK